MSDELKIVILTKGNAGSIGVQSPDCDPFFVMVSDGLEAILTSVPEVVAAARQKWESNPKYPKCETALPSLAQPVMAQTTARSAPQPKTLVAPKPQPQMF